MQDNGNKYYKLFIKFLIVALVNLNILLCKVWYNLKVIGKCTVPQTGPVVLVANHTSMIDPAVLAAAVKYRCPTYLMAKEYSNIPFLRSLFKILDCIPVDRDKQDVGATKAAIKLLRAGKLLGVFIEGGISVDGKKKALKRGAAMLALRTGAVIIPAYINGTEHKKRVILDIMFRHKARVKFGQPIKLEKKSKKQDCHDDILKVTGDIYDRILELRDEM